MNEEAKYLLTLISLYYLNIQTEDLTMALEKISDKQKEILEFIKSEILNRGYPPSVRDICEGVHLKSTSSVHAHLETLERKGYIRRDPAKNRAIEIIDDSFGLQRREMVNVPLVGRVAAGGADTRSGKYRNLLSCTCRVYAK